jgi:hypothetical protein
MAGAAVGADLVAWQAAATERQRMVVAVAV